MSVQYIECNNRNPERYTLLDIEPNVWCDAPQAAVLQVDRSSRIDTDCEPRHKSKPTRPGDAPTIELSQCYCKRLTSEINLCKRNATVLQVQTKRNQQIPQQSCSLKKVTTPTFWNLYRAALSGALLLVFCGALQADAFSLQPNSLLVPHGSPPLSSTHPVQQTNPNGIVPVQPTLSNARRPYSPAKFSKTCLNMALIPLMVEDMEDLISVDSSPTALQYAAYWGRTPRERYSRLVETFLVSILGMVFSYCLSFVLGGFVATILGAVFLFWGIFTPQLQAIQRNWEFLGGRALVDSYDDDNDNWFPNPSNKRGLYGGLFLGRLDDVCVVEDAAATPQDEFDLEDFGDYTMETDDQEQYTGNPYLLRVRLGDKKGRQLQVHARLSEEYLDLEPGMEVVCMLLSKSMQFDRLAALTDIYVPSAHTYIGDYPYLQRSGLENLLATDDEIWDTLQIEKESFETQDQGDFSRKKSLPKLPTRTKAGREGSWDAPDWSRKEEEEEIGDDNEEEEEFVRVRKRKDRRRAPPPKDDDGNW